MTNAGSSLIQLGCLIGSEHYVALDASRVAGLPGLPNVAASACNRLVAGKMLRKAERACHELRALPSSEWHAIFRAAADNFANAVLPLGDHDCSYAEYCRLTSLVSGLPESRIRSACDSLLADLRRISDVLDEQAAGLDADCFRTGLTGRGFTLVPTARHAAVRVPGNSPAVSITWIIALALRTPVLLTASPDEPFTVYRLAAAFCAAGLPDGALSVCVGAGAPFFELADKVIWSGVPPTSLLTVPNRVKTYHQGRSKSVVTRDLTEAEAERIAMHSRRGAGRMCTNVSGMLVLEGVDTERAAAAVARALAKLPILPLDHPEALVAAFPDEGLAQALTRQVESAVARGARDVSASIGAAELLQKHGELCFLRPTVLRVDADDPSFSLELPFPFVTVASSPRAEIVRRARNSLIVSVVGDDAALVRALVEDPGIDKVFYDDAFDRGFDALDTHEGQLSDFLYAKKAVRPIPRAQPRQVTP